MIRDTMSATSTTPGSSLADRLDLAAQLGALAQQPAVDPVLEPAPYRLEQDQDHERRDQRVEQVQALLAAADPVQEEPVHRRQQHDERAEHRHLADELVEVEQPVAEQRLRQEVEVEDAEHVADRGPRDAEPRQHVGQRQRGRDEAAEREIADPGALDALRGRAVLRLQVPDAAVQPAEHVHPERHEEPRGLVDRLVRSPT